MRGKEFKSEKGITLIALVITIIVLLILAGISIAMLTGDNGILNKVTTAKEETIKAQYEEELNLVITEMRTDAICKNEQFNMTYVIEKLPEYLEVIGNHEKTALEYPLVTEYGIANCSTEGLTQGDNLTIEITNKIKEDTVIYYSMDEGNTWNEYTQSFQIQYTGNNLIRAKSVNSKGTETKSRAMLYDGYAYDSEIECTAEDALNKKTYDGDENTYINAMEGRGKVYFAHTSLYNLVIGAQEGSLFFVYPYFGGFLHSINSSEWKWDGNLGYAIYSGWDKKISNWEGKFCKIGKDDGSTCDANIYEIWYAPSLCDVE